MARNITEETRRKLRQAGRKGGRIRAAQFTSEYQSWVRSHVRPESSAANGRKGWEALCAKYGLEYATGQLMAWRRANPSSLERIVAAWLDELGVDYACCEELLPGCYPDFVVGNLVVEVDGGPWHTDDAVPHYEPRARRDCERDKALRAAGYSVLRLTEAEIRDGTGRLRLEEVLNV